MIISENSDSYRMITQNDHGDLAGQFAAHWGNRPFAKLNPYQPMVLAAEAHDNGWWDWDIHPSIDDDGDGSLLLNLGILPVLGHERPDNLLIIVFDNGFYEAGGNKRSLAGFETRLEDMARGAGVDTVSVISNLGEFETVIGTALTDSGFRFFVVKTEPGRVGGDPKTTSGMEIKFRFARYVEESLGRSIFQPPTQTFKSATFK